MTDLVYLGPEGTFTHQAALALAPAGARLIALDALDAVLNALAQGRADYAVAAETSAAGSIELTVDAIRSGAAEVGARHPIAVSFDLYRRPGDAADLTGVYGHEKALAQVRPWIESGGLATRTAPSNTAGLALVRDGAPAGWGALGPPGLAAKYDLDVAERALEGRRRNETVFVLLRWRA